MCRQYGNLLKPGAYVRLCYRKGERRGEKIPAEVARGLGWRPSCCVPLAGARGRTNTSG